MATTVVAGQRSDPISVPVGSLVTVAPSSGGAASVEYTSGSISDIGNGVAVWAGWPSGIVTAVTSDVADKAYFVRVTAVVGTVTVAVDNSPSALTLSPFVRDWKSQYLQDNPGGIRTRLTSSICHHGVGTITTTGGGRSTNITWQETFMLPCGVDAVQIAPLTNAADVSTYTGVVAGVQCTDLTSTGADMQNPYLAGVLQSMQPVTWNGATNPTFTASPSLQTLVGPWSDWIPVNNTGVNSPSYLIARVYFPSPAVGGGMYAVDTNSGRRTKLVALGSNALFGAQVGNVATLNTAAMTTNQPSMPPLLIRFATRKRVPSIAIYGDSTRQGYQADGLVAAIERYAIAKSLAGTPVACNSRGITSQTSAQYLARLKSDVAAGDRFDVLVWQVCTPNDTQNSTTSQVQAANAHAAIRVAEQIGAKVVLEGPFPITASPPTGTQSAIVNGANAFCQAMNGIRPGITSVFYDGLHQTGSFGRWATGYNFDALHQNELGTTTVILPQLTAALDIATSTLA